MVTFPGSSVRWGTGYRTIFSPDLALILLVLQEANVLAILIGHPPLLQLPGKVRIRLGPLLQALLLQLDAGIDLIQSLLDLLGNGWRSGYVITSGPESVLIGRILHIDEGALRRLVRVLAVLDQHPVGIRLEVLQKARLLVHNAVACLVLRLVAAILALLLVVLDDRYPGARLSVILVPVMVRLVVPRNVIGIGMLVLVLLVLMMVLGLAGKSK